MADRTRVTGNGEIERLREENRRLRQAVADHREGLVGDISGRFWRDCEQCESVDLELWGSVLPDSNHQRVPDRSTK